MLLVGRKGTGKRRLGCVVVVVIPVSARHVVRVRRILIAQRRRNRILC